MHAKYKKGKGEKGEEGKKDLKRLESSVLWNLNWGGKNLLL